MRLKKKSYLEISMKISTNFKMMFVIWVNMYTWIHKKMNRHINIDTHDAS